MDAPSPRSRLHRELRFFAVAFGVPLLLLVAGDLLFTRSPLPLPARLRSFEDTCAYGACVVVPLVIYAVARLVSALRPSSGA